ncbi:hypothetical protein M1116_04235 [Patescibacteria group bacterium]|nr:hypothetical protein [Patescibacteria group bacterium]
MLVLFLLVNLFAFTFLLAAPALAHCPLCVAGAAAGLTLSRLLGVDDSITGIWLAAFLGATSFWFTTFTLRKLKFPLKKPLVYLLIFLSTLWSFYQFKLISTHNGDLFGLPRLTFGLLLGGAFFYLVDFLDALAIKLHHGIFFPYQRVVVSLGSLWALSLTVYLLINYFAF